MRNRVVLTCVILAVCVIFGIVFALVILPEPDTAGDETAVTTTLLEGEVEGHGGRVQMFDYVESKNVESVYVHNEHGTYSIVRSSASGALVIDGYEHIMLDQEKLAQMIVNAGYTISTYSAYVEEADFEKYGLAEGDETAYFVLKTTAGKRYTVYIGDKTLAGDGYYARYEGRNAIYVLDSGIERDLLGKVEYLAEPLLVYPSTVSSYYLVRNFTLAHGNEVFLMADYLNPDVRDELAAMSVHQLSVPGEYPAGNNYDSVLSIFCQFEASEVLSLDMSDESLAKYGLFEPAYQLYFDNTVLDNDGNPAGLVSNLVAFSEKQQDENGNYFYYVASYLFGIIGRVEEINADFLSWELDKWVSSNVFQVNILNVESLSLSTADLDVKFVLSGKDNDSLSVREENSGKTLDMSNFRKLWQVLLSVTHDGMASLDEETIEALTTDESNLLLTMTVTTRKGVTREYKFYPYTDRRVYYTVNGDGEFYLTNTMLHKAIADAKRVMNGEAVDPDTRY